MLSLMLDLVRVMHSLPSSWTMWDALALRAGSLIAQAMELETTTAGTVKMLESDALYLQVRLSYFTSVETSTLCCPRKVV